jgi:hypothetical protein
MRDARLSRIEQAAAGEVDVRYVGRIVRRAAPFLQARRRPLIIGASVAHVAVTAGTLGAFVRVAGSERPHLLSNNHVLADENDAAEGDAILQPAPADGGDAADDAVATLSAFEALDTARPNLVDAAVAAVNDGIEIDATGLLDAGTLAPGAARPGDGGRGGEARADDGSHDGCRHRLRARRRRGGLRQLPGPALRRPDRDRGDGPGPVQPRRRLRVADLHRRGPAGRRLLFAGGEENGADVTYANPIGAVLDALGATLIT